MSTLIRSILSLPIALLVAVIGWAAFWILHDYVWSLLPAGNVHVPWVVLVVVYCGGGYWLGKPLGKWLRSGGMAERPAAGLICVALVVVAAVLGEFLYVGSAMWSALGPVGPKQVLAGMIQPLLADNFGDVLIEIAQLLLRSLVGIGAIVGAMKILRPVVVPEIPNEESPAA